MHSEFARYQSEPMTRANWGFAGAGRAFLLLAALLLSCIVLVPPAAAQGDPKETYANAIYAHLGDCKGSAVLAYGLCREEAAVRSAHAFMTAEGTPEEKSAIAQHRTAAKLCKIELLTLMTACKPESDDEQGK